MALLQVLPGGSELTPSIERIQALISAGEVGRARAALRARVEERQWAKGHVEEARLAEALGESILAIRLWQLVLRDEPENKDAWAALALLHEEQGDLKRAEMCRSHLGLGGALGAAAREEEPQEAAPTREASDADWVRFAQLFAGREGVHARMWSDPQKGVGYSPMRAPLSPSVVRAHLSGEITAGTYLVQVDNRTSLLVIDLDADKSTLERVKGDAKQTAALRQGIHEEGLRMLRASRALGLDPLLEDSGFKGRHLWFFLESPQAAARVRAAGQRLAEHLGLEHPGLHVEVFPKQATVEPGGTGNLVKLPLGIHLKTGRRCPLLDDAGAPLEDPLTRLKSVRKMRLESLEVLPAPKAPGAPAKAPKAAPARGPTPEALPAELPWTELDFDTSSQVGPVLAGCGVLRALVKEVIERKHVDHDGVAVLNHSLGHLPDGVLAVNYLYDKVPNFPSEERMGAQHSGSPVSCKRMSQRVGRLFMEHCTRCTFPDLPGSYPNPLRHLEGAPDPKRVGRGVDDTLEAYARGLARLDELKAEVEALRREAVGKLSALPGGRWRGRGGEWAVTLDDGLPILVWEADGTWRS